MTVITDRAFLRSVDVAEYVGITYRQVDLIATQLGYNPRQGTPRRWTPEQAHQFAIAVALRDAAADRELPRYARAVFSAPDPPDTGWVVLADGRVAYGASPAVALRGSDGGIVARIPDTIWTPEKNQR